MSRLTHDSDRAVRFAYITFRFVLRRIPFHGLRHTAATLMFANGESVPVVQQRLGHGSAQITTEIYAHVLPTMGKAAAQRLGKLLHG